MTEMMFIHYKTQLAYEFTITCQSILCVDYNMNAHLCE